MIDSTTATLDTLGSVIAPLDTLQKSVNNWGGLWSFLGAIEWAAVGAIVTALFAIYAYSANRKSRRAHLLPADRPGYFRSPELGGSRIGLTITLENFGSNPAYKILGQIFLLDSKTCIISLPVGVVNPIAPGGKWIIGLGLPVLELLSKGDRGIWHAIYIVMKIQYFDILISR